MKYKSLCGLMLAVVGLFAACDPSTVEGSSEWATPGAESLELSATPVVVNGMNSNRITVSNKSEVNSQWVTHQLIDGDVVNVFSEGEVYVTQLGEQQVTFKGFNGGEMLERTLTVQVDTLTYLTDAITSRLCIGQEGAPTHFGVDFEAGRIEFEQTMSEDGQGGNSITVTSNLNPVLCTFKWGTASMNTNVGKITTYALGENMDFTVDILTADGTTRTYNLGQFSASVYTDLPQAITQLTGWSPDTAPTATKTWAFADDGKEWGNGQYGDMTGTWWMTTVDSQGGSTGTMTFDFVNGTLTKVIDNPGNERGDASGVCNFTLDFSTAAGNIICTLRTEGNSNILFPYLINENYAETHTFQVVTLTDTEMWLCAQHTDPSNTEGTFWHFKAVEE